MVVTLIQNNKSRDKKWAKRNNFDESVQTRDDIFNNTRTEKGGNKKKKKNLQVRSNKNPRETQMLITTKILQ